MDSPVKPSIRPELVPLVAACVLAPVIGGQVTMDALPMPPGGFFEGALGGFELPMGARLILGLLVFGGLAYALLSRRVLQGPGLPVGASILVLVATLGFSIANSSFPWASYSAWPTWALYGAATFLTVMAVGRWSGVRAVLWGLMAGGGLVAVKSILEYAAVRAQEPSYRVFGDWNNPNALAGVLIAVLPVGVGLALTGERVERLLGFVAATLVAFSLVLTQSRGGVLALGVGLAAFVVLCLVWRQGRAAWGAVVPVAVAAGLGGLLVLTQPQVQGGAAFARVTTAAASQEHSAGFRSLLWRSTVELARSRPMGVGVGAYRFESARPGLVVQTFYAHQTYLQVLAEGGVTALLALLAAVMLWFRSALGGMLKTPPERRVLQASVVSGVVAVGAHGFVESNLYYLGLGFVAFVLLGVALQLAPDGSNPELTPRGARWGLVLLGVALPLAAIVHTSVQEATKSEAMAARAGQTARAREAALSAVGTGPFDGEAWFLSALIAAESNADRRLRLQRATQYQPTPRYLRALSDAERQAGNPLSAVMALDRALLFDPNNLPALERRYRLQDEIGELEQARQTARRLVAVEESPAYRVRAIPELVPVETFDARVFLARDEPDATERLRLMREAAMGFARYAETTWPLVQRNLRNAPDAEFLGETLASGREVLRRGQSAAEAWGSLALAAGDSAEAAEAARVASIFAEG